MHMHSARAQSQHENRSHLLLPNFTHNHIITHVSCSKVVRSVKDTMSSGEKPRHSTSRKLDEQGKPIPLKARRSLSRKLDEHGKPIPIITEKRLSQSEAMIEDGFNDDPNVAAKKKALLDTIEQVRANQAARESRRKERQDKKNRRNEAKEIVSE